jgi:hypothetical protein
VGERPDIVGATGRRYQWRERFAASSYTAQGAVQAEAVLPPEAASDVAYAAARAVLVRFYAAVQAAGEDFIPTPSMVRDIANAGKTLLEMERLKEGKSTQNVAVSDSRAVPDEVMNMLTVEQLRALASGGEDD